MNRRHQRSVLIFFFFIARVSAYGQIEINHTEAIEKIKNGTTYVVMKNPESPRITEYIKAFKEVWTFSKLEFIRYAELGKYLLPDNSFFTIGGYETSVDETEVSSRTGRTRQGLHYSNTHF